MNNFSDIFKNRFLEEFTEITLESMLTALVMSFLLSCIVLLVYRVTYKGVLFNANFAVSLILLSMVTSMVILTVSSNVVLSLGMVGALSIVRFRTAVKDPMDTVFMFWAIVTGIMTGAGLVPIALISTLLVGALFILAQLFSSNLGGSSYLVIIRFDPGTEGAVEEAVSKISRKRLKSKSISPDGGELVLETRRANTSLEEIRKIEGVREVNMISYTGTTLL